MDCQLVPGVTSRGTRSERLFAFRTGHLDHLLTRVAFDGHALEERFGLGQELSAQLIGPPTLPTFEFACRGQNRLRFVIEFFIDHARALFQSISELHGRLCTGFSVPLSQLGLELFDGRLGALSMVGFLLWVDFLLGRLKGDRVQRRAVIFDLFGPCGHGRQGFLGVIKRFLRLQQGGAQCVPNRLELLAAVDQGAGVLQVDTAPLRVSGNSRLLAHPGRDVLPEAAF